MILEYLAFFNPFMFLDPLYIMLIGPTVLLALFAQLKVKGAYTRMSRIGTARGCSGAEAAARIMNSAGVTDVKIEMANGWLSDHYDPSKRVLRLSPDVFNGRSIAAVGIAAHEAGHALQHAGGYAPLNLRSTLVPLAGFGSWLAWPMIFIGMLLSSMAFVKTGIFLFSILVLFQIITLPVEFNASSRAKSALAGTGIVINQQEMNGVASVLNAAALTYVAATVTAIAQLLYFVLRSGLLGGGRND
ncbi:MAG: zinc metallopeptidase [Planctomycetota bacterium]